MASPTQSQQTPQGPPLTLADLVQDTVVFLGILTKALEGDDANVQEHQEVGRQKSALETKYRAFAADPRRAQPASEESLKRLEKLKREIERKNIVLETLQRGLKEFELEISLRSGASNKRAVSKARARERQENSSQEEESVLPVPKRVDSI